MVYGVDKQLGAETGVLLILEHGQEVDLTVAGHGHLPDGLGDECADDGKIVVPVYRFRLKRLGQCVRRVDDILEQLTPEVAVGGQ